MVRRNTFTLMAILALLSFAICALLLPLFGRDEMQLGLDLKGGIRLVYEADFSAIPAGGEDEAIDGVVLVLSNRINPLGVTEPNIERRGDNRIVLELPEVGLSDVQKDRIGRTTLLEFGELAGENEEAKWENELGRWKPATTIIDSEEKALTSRYFQENTYISVDEFQGIQLIFEWDDEGSEISEAVTFRLLNQQLGIFDGEESLRGEDGIPIAPVVQSVISQHGRITGLSRTEAEELSKQLNAGRLPVPLEPVYEQTVTPLLGADFVNLSITAGAIGIALVMLFMILYYRLPGLVASLSLIFYGALVMAIFKLIPVTLTLAGIGGFILSIGMAVDANVLIFERMKEELTLGQTLGAAIEAGFNRAWTAIRDSNITTFIVCVILYWVGNSVVAGAPVKGFALTLFIGVAASMFTAIVVTRTLLRLFVGTRIAQRTRLFNIHSERK